jgi:flavin reductase (DIM6/NTAB) family NADH-FMN oxidoreductase RutF
MSSDKEQRREDPTAHEQMLDGEAAIKRNPHGNFKEVEASRPAWREQAQWDFTQTRNPAWQAGDGANDNGESLKHDHVDIDPYADGRPATFNYKLLISAIVPRPVGFVSTRSADGQSTNLAPFSYFNLVNHDPPIFIIGYAGGFDKAKDSLRNLTESKECCINIISEHYLEAANATSVNAPYGISEWALTGLTPAECKDVKASRVKEAVFSIEAKLFETKEFESRATPGKKTGVLAIVEGVRFWAREDAVNEDKNLIDPAVSVHKYPSRWEGMTCSICTGPLTHQTDPPPREQTRRHHLWPRNRRRRDPTSRVERAEQDRRSSRHREAKARRPVDR